MPTVEEGRQNAELWIAAAGIRSAALRPLGVSECTQRLGCPFLTMLGGARVQKRQVRSPHNDAGQ
jgi:hypothetical protein